MGNGVSETMGRRRKSGGKAYEKGKRGEEESKKKVKTERISRQVRRERIKEGEGGEGKISLFGRG